MSQKNETLDSLSIASPNINRFSKKIYCQTQKEMCNKAITKDSTTPQKRPYTTL